MNKLFAKGASLFRNLTRKHQQERELNAELSGYVEMLAEQKMKTGMDERQAYRAAMVETEGIEQVKEQVRDIRCGHRFELFLRDLEFAFRTLRKAPGFSFAVALVLSLGIGSTTLMFTIVNSVLLQGPAVPAADRLVTLWNRIPQEPRISFSPKDFTAWE